MQAVCAISVPSTRQQIREFLGAAGFCRIWILGFSDLAKHLYEALKGEEKAPIEWGPQQEKAFISIKVMRKGKIQYQKETSVLTQQQSRLPKNKQHQHGSCWPLNYLNLQSTLLRRRNGLIKKWAKEQKKVGGYSQIIGFSHCLLCVQNNAKQGPVGPIEVQRCGQTPFEDLEVDFTEAYPTHTERAREVTKVFLKDIILWYRMPLTIGSVNGPAFVAEMVQQSSGKVECMNWTLKQAMAKLCQETTLPWTDILPLYSCRWVTDQLPISLGTAVHSYKPGDQVWVKDWRKESLKPIWKGPYPVILTTPTALKFAGLNTWIHHSRVKAAHQPSDAQLEWKVTSDQKHSLQITLKKTRDLADQPAPRNSEMPC
ncbi:hypothetical protein QTO34_000591 [Cnephaeus nilssonii]|uniref:Murine leukemia virus integrase C-terminal domain-containing protein n=1 Tax=Cnephaeus nilssonii TaxID=3371016 RepID=A0AA40ICJ8_CNENI|nr:hypothetical protein QTO34_000591 [Eptesicus nilssonii]